MDFFRTSAPTPAAALVKVVMAVSNQLGYPVRQFDVAQAFTKAPLDYRVIMKFPGGCGELSGKYVRLEKALYGLRQSGLLWNDLLVSKLVKVHGMEQCKTDPCAFRLIREGKVVLILTVHVDDMAVGGPEDEIDKLLVVLNEDFTTNDLRKLSFFTGCAFTQNMAVGGPEDEIDKLLVVLNEDFTTNDLRELSFFTGCAFTQNIEQGTIKITQTSFVETLARRFDVTTTSLYPASPTANLEAKREGEPGGVWAYQEAVGCLMWLVIMTRLDIANAVRAVARHSMILLYGIGKRYSKSSGTCLGPSI